MTIDRTIQALATITDEGLFERLATAILRESDPSYRALVHPGVNLAGKTVKSPLDGISFVARANPPHMIAVHHTITAREGLEKKWLHDPSKVKPRKGAVPTASAGDLIKTGELVAEERLRTPDLLATLVLTTNQEPSEDLIRMVHAAGRDRGLEIDIWSNSRMSHFLDQTATGQWIRRSFLGIEQELLSAELLGDLSKKSLETNAPMDDPTAWIPRALDETLRTSLRQDVTFLMAGSGSGKSVASFRRLAEHIDAGGFGLVLPHEALSTATTLEHAVKITLHQLHPSLAADRSSPLSFCSIEKPLFLIVEDINRSGQAQLLVEKLLSWSSLAKNQKGEERGWRLLCPIWPEVLAQLGDQARKLIEPLVITIRMFSETEGRDAVLARAKLEGRQLSPLSAESVSQALGHDPLLIALHDHSTAPDPDQVIGRFIEGALSRAAAESRDHTAADYRQALRALAGKMLTNRQLELNWDEVNGWDGFQPEHLRLLGRLMHRGELIRLTGPSHDQGLSFRHDRVRDWLLSDAVIEMEQRNLLPEEVVSDPYFAEVLGAILVWGTPNSNFLQLVSALNPLSLFHSLRLFGLTAKPPHDAILQAIDAWLNLPATHCASNHRLRCEALAMLAETDSPKVLEFVRKFSGQNVDALLARFRNGDLLGGTELCRHFEPGAGAWWRDRQIEHVKLRYGHKLTKTLDALLRRTDLGAATRVGALRLAGHMMDPKLAVAVEACWISDVERCNHLDDYLWAFGECSGENAARFLGPVCDAWAALPDQSDKENWPSPRDNLAAHELRWAFQKWPPAKAIDFFVQRASQEDLRWPITYMLHGMDHPKAVLFVVQELAEIQRRLEGTESFSPFVMSAKDDWRRAQENGRPMSKLSRDALCELWLNENNDRHLRTQAFTFWAVTKASDDLELLRAASPPDWLADNILRERLVRGDQLAVSEMIKKLTQEDNGFWWYSGRHVWSDDLTEALDLYLGKRGKKAKMTWGEAVDFDHITSEMLMRLPEGHSERILLKHWDHLRFSSYFIQTALYVGTPSLLEAVKTSVAECPEPANLFKHLSTHFGIKMHGHPGLTRDSQVVAIAPYLDFLSSVDIMRFTEACNDNGWFTVRKSVLDHQLQNADRYPNWDPQRIDSKLDSLCNNKELRWLDRWIEDVMKTGVSWAEIFTLMSEWVKKRGTFDSLKVVAAAVSLLGTRKDLKIFEWFHDSSDASVKELIANTEFAVRRRSIR